MVFFIYSSILKKRRIKLESIVDYLLIYPLKKKKEKVTRVFIIKRVLKVYINIDYHIQNLISQFYH